MIAMRMMNGVKQMKNPELMKYIGEHISPDLFKRMGAWLEENPVEVYWDYNDKVSDKQIDMLLNGESWQFVDDIYEFISVSEYYWDLERDKIQECMWVFMDEMTAGIVIDQDDIEGDDIWDLEEVLELRQFSCINLNERDLIRNAHVRLTLDLELEHEYMPQDEYDAAEQVLEFFNINPRIMWLLFNGYFNSIQGILAYGDGPIYLNPDDGDPWPDIPERNGQEFVDPVRLYQSWINMPYSGCYVALLGGPSDLLTLAYRLEDADEKDKYLELTLPPNTPLVTHAYWPGSGGTFFYLKREMKVRLVKDNQLARDGAFGYGVDDVHGLVSDMWETEFTFELKEESNEHLH